MKLLTTVLLLLLTSAYSSAKDTFTALEQQQISIETPGLFEKSNIILIDFSILREDEYSFPLPVGKPTILSNNSMEIETTKGDAVKAMFDGVVRLSRNNSTYGNVIVIRHDNGLETVYGNNAQNMVKVGDVVRAGQTIAIVGTKDNRTYSIFEIMVDGRRINPETVLSVKAHRLRHQTIQCEKHGFGIKVSVAEAESKKWQVADDKADSPQIEGSKDPFAGGKGQFSINFGAMSPTDWCYPLPGAHMISPYGGARRHKGTDLKTKPNDEIKAAFDGQVIMSQVYSAYGNCIIIRHALGIETLYSHNSKNLVKVGDWVKAGQTIALTGRTGRATTEHLHYEMRVNGIPFDTSRVYDHNANKLKKVKMVFTKQGGGVKITEGK